jgi:hypothetical protein
LNEGRKVFITIVNGKPNAWAIREGFSKCQAGTPSQYGEDIN